MLYLLGEEKPLGMLSAAIRGQALLSEEKKRRQLKIKISVAYFIAKEDESFLNCGPLIGPDKKNKKNRVDVNPTYNNDVRCAK